MEDRLAQLEGIVGALSGQVIVLLAQNRTLQQLLIEGGLMTGAQVRAATLDLLDAELDEMADQILPAEISGPVKQSLRDAVAQARNA